MSYIVHAEVKLNTKKSTDKAYFEKMYNKFNREFMQSGVIEQLKLKRCFYKPSVLKKVKKELAKFKWKYYNY